MPYALKSQWREIEKYLIKIKIERKRVLKLKEDWKINQDEQSFIAGWCCGDNNLNRLYKEIERKIF